jgi:hypothetical protein
LKAATGAPFYLSVPLMRQGPDCNRQNWLDETCCDYKYISDVNNISVNVTNKSKLNRTHPSFHGAPVFQRVNVPAIGKQSLKIQGRRYVG